MAPDGSSMSTAARALVLGAGAMLSDLGRGAAAHGSGMRCGTNAAAFGSGSAGAAGGTAREELVAAARRGAGVSVGTAAGAALSPEPHATARTASNASEGSRLSIDLGTLQKGPACFCAGRPFDDYGPI